MTSPAQHRGGAPAIVGEGLVRHFGETEWLATIATYNPVTYLLEGLRSLVMVGWDATALLQALAAIAGVAVVSQSLALAALRGRLRSGKR